MLAERRISKALLARSDALAALMIAAGGRALTAAAPAQGEGELEWVIVTSAFHGGLEADVKRPMWPQTLYGTVDGA
jgi:hypothetical protein